MYIVEHTEKSNGVIDMTVIRRSMGEHQVVGIKNAQWGKTLFQSLIHIFLYIFAISRNIVSYCQSRMEQKFISIKMFRNNNAAL